MKELIKEMRKLIKFQLTKSEVIFEPILKSKSE